MVAPRQFAGIDCNQRPRRLQYLGRLAAVEVSDEGRVRYSKGLRHWASYRQEPRPGAALLCGGLYLPRRLDLALGSSGPLLVVSASLTLPLHIPADAPAGPYRRL